MLRQQLALWVQALCSTLHNAGAFSAVPRDDPAMVLRALAALRQQQVLCALREGDFGAYAVNDAIEESLRKANAEYADAVWYPGRAVMISHNDNSTGLFNGDVGICLRDESGGMQVWFERHSTPTALTTDAGLRLVRLNPGSVPTHRGAFAMTIHKSQGSEYDQVAVLLPPDADNPILSRQLLKAMRNRMP
jgi:exodeoxyribonuclease V alpha subunit